MQELFDLLCQTLFVDTLCPFFITFLDLFLKLLVTMGNIVQLCLSDKL